MREWTETRPSKLALAMTAGLRGHHDTSKLHCCDEASSHTTSPEGAELGFQQRIRLSLPQESSRSESCWHQATERMPLWNAIQGYVIPSASEVLSDKITCTVGFVNCYLRVP